MNKKEDKAEEMEQIKQQYPKGYIVRIWTWILIVLFTGAGVITAIITEKYILIVLGLAVGICVGIAIGVPMEKKYKKEGWIRPLTKYEKKKRWISIVSSIVLALLGLGVICIILFQ